MKQNGFTLIELLVALSLMTVMAVFSYKGLDILFKSKQYADQVTLHTQTLMAVIAQWKLDLDMVQVVKKLEPSGLAFDGRSLLLVKRSSIKNSDGTDPGLQVVAWTHRTAAQLGQPTGQWMRWRSPYTTQFNTLEAYWKQAQRWAKNPSNEDLAYQVSLMPLNGWQLTYFLGNAWFNPLSSQFTVEFDHAEVGKALLDKTQRQDAVRLVLDLPQGERIHGRLVIDWTSPDI